MVLAGSETSPVADLSQTDIADRGRLVRGPSPRGHPECLPPRPKLGRQGSSGTPTGGLRAHPCSVPRSQRSLFSSCRPGALSVGGRLRFFRGPGTAGPLAGAGPRSGRGRARLTSRRFRGRSLTIHHSVSPPRAAVASQQPVTEGTSTSGPATRDSWTSARSLGRLF